MQRCKEEERVAKMKETLLKEVEPLSVSPYDTAWVAMVGRNNNDDGDDGARFPQCLRWVAENQQADGSWSSHPAHPRLVKDSLSSTLASVLALRRWGVADQLVDRGLEFIRCNAWAATDKNQRTPIGFDVVFPGMMESAAAMGLNFPFTPSTFQAMLQKRHPLVQLQSCCNTDDKEWLEFSVEDFNRCQSLHRKELEGLERWVKEYRIEEVKFAREKAAYSFFAAAAIVFLPEHADARSLWAKNTALVTLVDDLIDFGGSEEEILNLIDLVKAWDGEGSSESVGYCSEQVEIIFKAVYDATNEYAAKASLMQGRFVKHHFLERWVALLECMWQEYVRARDNIIPTMEEYMATGYVSVGVGLAMLPPMYLLGIDLPEEAVRSQEYEDMYMHVSVIARLLNDLATAERESAQGKENSLALTMMQGDHESSEEEARREIQRVIEEHEKELLRMVVLKEGSIVPRAVKQVFWQTTKIVHMFYMSEDGFSSPHQMVAAIDSVIYNPIVLPHHHHHHHHSST